MAFRYVSIGTNANVAIMCDDDGYSIGDFSWDWATVRTTGGGGYYLVGDRWGIIDPVATSIPWLNLWMVNVWWPFSILWLT